MLKTRAIAAAIGFAATTFIGAGLALAPQAVAVAPSDFGTKPQIYLVKDTERGYDQYLGIARSGGPYIRFANHDPSHGITQCFTGSLRHGRLIGTAILITDDGGVLDIDPGFRIRLRKRGGTIILGRADYWSTFHRTNSRRIGRVTRARLALCQQVLAHADD